MFDKIISAVNQIVPNSFLVGGAVRDHLLGLEIKDWDFASAYTPDEIQQYVENAGRKAFTIGKKFGTIGFKVEVDGKFYPVEITTFRTEQYPDNTRKPQVHFVTDIVEDLARRDFTINAMAINKDGVLLDPFGGMDDLLTNKLIKTVGTPKQRFAEDPLRILRMVRFSGRYGFEIDLATKKKAHSMRWELLRVSKERWVLELDNILSHSKASEMIDLCFELELFQIMIPELQLQYNYDQNSKYHQYVLHEHTCKVIAAVSDMHNLELSWVALLHDIAKPFTRTQNKSGYSNYINHELLGAEMASSVCRNLKFSNKKHDFIVTEIKNHLNDASILRPFDNMSK
jgi:tRNA nucleotidyltransferase (CCA-adding enzyme)